MKIGNSGGNSSENPTGPDTGGDPGVPSIQMLQQSYLLCAVPAHDGPLGTGIAVGADSLEIAAAGQANGHGDLQQRVQLQMIQWTSRSHVVYWDLRGYRCVLERHVVEPGRRISVVAFGAANQRSRRCREKTVTPRAVHPSRAGQR